MTKLTREIKQHQTFSVKTFSAITGILSMICHQIFTMATSIFQTRVRGWFWGPEPKIRKHTTFRYWRIFTPSSCCQLVHTSSSCVFLHWVCCLLPLFFELAFSCICLSVCVSYSVPLSIVFVWSLASLETPRDYWGFKLESNNLINH